MVDGKQGRSYLVTEQGPRRYKGTFRDSSTYRFFCFACHGWRLQRLFKVKEDRSRISEQAKGEESRELA